MAGTQRHTLASPAARSRSFSGRILTATVTFSWRSSAASMLRRKVPHRTGSKATSDALLQIQRGKANGSRFAAPDWPERSHNEIQALEEPGRQYFFQPTTSLGAWAPTQPRRSSVRHLRSMEPGFQRANTFAHVRRPPAGATASADQRRRRNAHPSEMAPAGSPLASSSSSPFSWLARMTVELERKESMQSPANTDAKLRLLRVASSRGAARPRSAPRSPLHAPQAARRTSPGRALPTNLRQQQQQQAHEEHTDSRRLDESCASTQPAATSPATPTAEPSAGAALDSPILMLWRPDTYGPSVASHPATTSASAPATSVAPVSSRLSRPSTVGRSVVGHEGRQHAAHGAVRARGLSSALRRCTSAATLSSSPIEYVEGMESPGLEAGEGDDACCFGWGVGPGEHFDGTTWRSLAPSTRAQDLRESVQQVRAVCGRAGTGSDTFCLSLRPLPLLPLLILLLILLPLSPPPLTRPAIPCCCRLASTLTDTPRGTV